MEEALLLADRVLVMDEGVIRHELTVELPHPRAVDDPGFNAMRGQLLAWLGVRPASVPSAAPPAPGPLQAVPA
ncbi:Aliphatic sulfonates import ATP-binding protein SsuB [compost metagenome]